MRALVGMVSCILIVLVVTQSSAQIDDSSIPKCGEEEIGTLTVILHQYLDLYADISDQMEPITLDDFAVHTDAVDELIGDMHELQVQWRREGEPQLPRCSLAVDAGAKLGRLLDETLIAILLLDADYRSFADWHADPILDLSSDLGALLSQLEQRSA